MRDRPAGRSTRALPGYNIEARWDVLLRMRHTHKWRLIHPETSVELSVCYLTVSPSLFVAKDQSRLVIESLGVKTIVFSQTNSSVGVMKKKKKKMEKIEVRPISVYNCSGVF